MNLWNLLINCAEKGLSLQKSDGSMPPGNNGPWCQQETPVRTTAHWALSFFRAWELTGEERFSNAFQAACRFLISKETRPEGCAFHCRKTTSKDPGNNLVGQAWALEPLVLIGKALNREAYLDVACKVARAHSFQKNPALWRRLEPDGRAGPLCRTLNQQIMLSSVVLILADTVNDSDLKEKARLFFETFLLKVWEVEAGLPHHKINIASSLSPPARGVLTKLFWKENVDRFRWKKESVGYLPFILYGLALAHRFCSRESFWDKDEIRQWIRGLLTFVEQRYPYGWREHERSFRWAYNPVGFEVAFALEEFKDLMEPHRHPERQSRWIFKQLEGYYNQETGLMDCGTGDPVILAARIYEAVWLPDVELPETILRASNQ